MQIKDRQTLLDVAVQSTADAGNAVQIAVNQQLSLTDSLDSLPEVATPAAALDKTAAVELMNKPANAPASNDGALEPEGIGYWRIGIDFKIGG